MKKQMEKENRHMCETFHNLKEQGFLKGMRRMEEIILVTGLMARKLK